MKERKQVAIILGVLLVFNVIGSAFLYRGSGKTQPTSPSQQQQQQQQQQQEHITEDCGGQGRKAEEYRHAGRELSYEIRYDDPTKWREFKAFDMRVVEAQLTREEVPVNGSRPYFEECLAKYRHAAPAKVQASLLDWVTLEPAVQLNASCTAPPLPDPAKLDCKWPHDQAGFAQKRAQPRKLGLAVLYGFEVDVLEMLLSEVYDVVDRVFLCENMRSHRHDAKPLLWERLKAQPRFARYSDRVVHLVLDDADALPQGQKHQLFDEEANQERRRFQKVMEWNVHNKFFGADDYIGFGDADEIPSRNSLQYLRWCDADHRGPIDIGTWFVYCNVHHSWRSDFPVPGHPYTLGDPTFHLVADLLAKHAAGDTSPSRNRGRSGHYLLGGTHATTYTYAPSVLLKFASCTECSGLRFPPEGIPFGEAVDRLDHLQLDGTRGVHSRGPDLRGRLGREEHYPWIVMCNPERYKTWYDLRDERLFLPKEKIPFTC